MLPSSPSLRAAATACGAISPPVSTQRRSTHSPMRGNANTEDWPIDKKSSISAPPYVSLFLVQCNNDGFERGECGEINHYHWSRTQEQTLFNDLRQGIAVQNPTGWL